MTEAGDRPGRRFLERVARPEGEYNPIVNPFTPRPDQRTPTGMEIAEKRASTGELPGGWSKLTQGAKAQELGAPTADSPAADSARKWLQGQARRVASPAAGPGSPASPGAARASWSIGPGLIDHSVTDATPTRSSAQGAGVGSPGLSPPLTTGSEMTPQARKAVADVYPRSFPVARSRKEDLVAVAQSTPAGGLAGWLRQSRTMAEDGSDLSPRSDASGAASDLQPAQSLSFADAFGAEVPGAAMSGQASPASVKARRAAASFAERGPSLPACGTLGRIAAALAALLTLALAVQAGQALLPAAPTLVVGSYPAPTSRAIFPSGSILSLRSRINQPQAPPPRAPAEPAARTKAALKVIVGRGIAQTQAKPSTVDAGNASKQPVPAVIAPATVAPPPPAAPPRAATAERRPAPAASTAARPSAPATATMAPRAAAAQLAIAVDRLRALLLGALKALEARLPAWQMQAARLPGWLATGQAIALAGTALALVAAFLAALARSAGKVVGEGLIGADSELPARDAADDTDGKEVQNLPPTTTPAVGGRVRHGRAAATHEVAPACEEPPSTGLRRSTRRKTLPANIKLV